MISIGAFILALVILVAGVLYDNHRRRKAAIHRASFRPKHVIEFQGRAGEAGVSRTPNAAPGPQYP